MSVTSEDIYNSEDEQQFASPSRTTQDSKLSKIVLSFLLRSDTCAKSFQRYCDRNQSLCGNRGSALRRSCVNKYQYYKSVKTNSFDQFLRKCNKIGLIESDKIEASNFETSLPPGTPSSINNQFDTPTRIKKRNCETMDFGESSQNKICFMLC